MFENEKKRKTYTSKQTKDRDWHQNKKKKRKENVQWNGVTNIRERFVSTAVGDERCKKNGNRTV